MVEGSYQVDGSSMLALAKSLFHFSLASLKISSKKAFGFFISFHPEGSDEYSSGSSSSSLLKSKSLSSNASSKDFKRTNLCLYERFCVC